MIHEHYVTNKTPMPYRANPPLKILRMPLGVVLITHACIGPPMALFYYAMLSNIFHVF